MNLEDVKTDDRNRPMFQPLFIEAVKELQGTDISEYVRINADFIRDFWVEKYDFYCKGAADFLGKNAILNMQNKRLIKLLEQFEDRCSSHYETNQYDEPNEICEYGAEINRELERIEKEKKQME